jgi:hypothetical protein
MKTETVVRELWRGSANRLAAALVSALGHTLGEDGAALEKAFHEELLGSGLYAIEKTTETFTLTGVTGSVLELKQISEQINGPVDPDETLVVTVGAHDPARLAAALAVLASA